MRRLIGTGALVPGTAVFVGVCLIVRMIRWDAPSATRAAAPSSSPSLKDRRHLAPAGAEAAPSTSCDDATDGTFGPPADLAETCEPNPGVPDGEDWLQFWTDLEALVKENESLDDGEYRRAALRIAAEYLGLQAGAAEAFERAHAQVDADLQRARLEREQALAGAPGGLKNEALMESQEHYAADKRAALSRLDVFLDGSTRHERFRRALDAWVDALHTAEARDGTLSRLRSP